MDSEYLSGVSDVIGLDWFSLFVACCFAWIFQYLTDLWLMVGLGSGSFLAPGLVKVAEKIFSRPKVRLEDTKSPGTSFNSWLPHKVIIVPETRWKRNAKISQTVQRRWRPLARVASKLVRRSGKLVMVSKAVTIVQHYSPALYRRGKSQAMLAKAVLLLH